MATDRYNRLISLGFTPTQAAGRPGKFELAASDILNWQSNPTKNNLVAMVLEAAKVNPEVIPLYKQAKADGWEKSKRGERMRPMNELLYAISESKRKHAVVFRTPGEIYKGSPDKTRKGKRGT